MCVTSVIVLYLILVVFLYYALVNLADDNYVISMDNRDGARSALTNWIIVIQVIQTHTLTHSSMTLSPTH